ncbi:hypothetical protein [Candidatus Albibeggiatoa sp. nov. BB20]|uniref:hypothetical protein n=1 Tax=Candidatus Albibeggiatoa sp. nov. BB20 TaxID=3162723 RepID=UPI0033654D19
MSKITSFTSGITLTVGVILTLYASMWTKFTDMTVTSPIIFSIFLMILGLLFMRGLIKEQKTPEQEKAEMLQASNVSHTLIDFKHAVEQLEISDNVDILVETIEGITENYLLLINHQHQAINDIYGLQGLEIIMNLAQAERLLNRIQSAALDGYPYEVQNSYDELRLVVQHLKCNDNAG